jgi:ribonucleoside-diphosphate reductase alpha chain
MPFLTRKGDAAMAMANLQASRPVKTASNNASQSLAKRFHGRLKVDATFCPTDVDDLFSTVDWEVRSAQIKGENGELIFEQTNCEVPSFWSQLATNVICSKYFYGEVGTPEREYSVRQLVHRVARTIADWGLEDGYFASAQDGERFYRDLAWLCLHQHGAFNSPVWFNVGLYHQYGVKGAKCNWRWDAVSRSVVQPDNPYEFPQGSACFIQRVEDNMEDIMELARSEAMLFKFGSGTGTDLSTLRSHREKLAGGGKPSGPLSFMRVYDQVAAVVKSGGKTRRAAKMQSLKVWHPDVMEFIECKWKEEQKARVLIEKGGYEANFNGEAYSSIMFQNANLSVRVTDDFMQAVERNEDWTTHWVTNPDQPGPTYPAREVVGRMAECAWHCGDPGVQYDTTINRWHTCPNSGRINASNPCVTGDTLVATAEGLVPIKGLVDTTPEVIGSDGRLHSTTRVIRTGKKPVYELRTKCGYALKLTADHRVQTVDRGDVAACDLRQGDRVALCAPVFGANRLPTDVAEFIGLTLGCGWIEDGIIPGLLEQESDFDVSQRLETLTKRGLVNDGYSGSSVAVSGCSTALVELISRYVVLNEGASRIRLTEKALQFDRDTCASLLRGLFTAEGQVDDASWEVRLRTTSPELVKQVQLLLLAFGIKSKRGNVNGHAVTKMLFTEGGCLTASKWPRYSQLRIPMEFRSAYHRCIDFLDESSKPNRMEEMQFNAFDYSGLAQYDDIQQPLRLLGEEDVFDLTEPVTNHFVANGIVVHNCSEYMFLDDTACNLASINLMKFRKPDGVFDAERFQAACRIFFIAQEILVDHASYPTPDIARNSHLFRPLGLGYSNLGSLLMSEGTPYDSDAGRGVCGAVTALLHGAANLTSSELAEAVGPFDEYDKNREPMLRVMQMHRDAVDEINGECPSYLVDAARRTWDDVLAAGRVHGFRNAQATVLAPTGTISFMMDCDTTGIEPDIALVKYKQLAGGGMLKIVNQTVPLALTTMGYDQPQIGSILAYVNEHDTIEGSPDLKPEHLAVFDCAFSPRNGERSIRWQAHVLMMAAAQPFLSGAISKTVNMPRETTPDDIAKAYVDGWKLGLKALAIYRDGSKESQPLSTSSEGQKAAAAAAVAAKPRRERLPDTRQSITHKFNVAGHEGYITVGLFPSKPGELGRPGELFITMAKEGSTIGGLMDAFGTAVSMSLQYGVPLEDYVRKFSHMRFEPQGYTKNPDIRIAKSLIDYIFRWLGNTFLPGFKEASQGMSPGKDDDHGERAERAGASSPPTETVVPGSGFGAQSSSPKPHAPVADSGSSPKTKPAADQRHGDDRGSMTATLAPQHPASSIQHPASKTNGHANGHANGSSNGQANGHSNAVVDGHAEFNFQLLTRAGVLMKDGGPTTARSEQFADFQSDAPACDNCGAITVRNGNCYLCHNCGSSMGCS